jgi:hypothetical protein
LVGDCSGVDCAACVYKAAFCFRAKRRFEIWLDPEVVYEVRKLVSYFQGVAKKIRSNEEVSKMKEVEG